jgi:hypothetical protein
MQKEFDFFKDWSQDKQNRFLEEYLTTTTKYLKRFEFLDSKGCYYFLPEFFDDAYHGNSITNLATLLMLLMKRDYILPIRFINDKSINPAVGSPVIYYIFSNWPVGNLSDKDFDSFEMLQDDELLQYANILAN